MLIITLSILTFAGFATLLYAADHADAGYEDELGFHPGVEPAPQILAVPAPRGPEKYAELPRVTRSKSDQPKIESVRQMRRPKKLSPAAPVVAPAMPPSTAQNPVEPIQASTPPVESRR